MESETCTHVLTLDGDLQHLPQEAASLLTEAAQSGADLVLGERTVRTRRDAGVALSRQPDRQPRPVVVRRRAGARHAVRVPAVPRRSAAPTARSGDRLRDRNRNARQSAAARRRIVVRCRSPPSTAERQQAASRSATPRGHVFSRCTTASSNASDLRRNDPFAPSTVPNRGAGRCTGSTTGEFSAATCAGVRRAATRRLVRDRARRHWLAWRLMPRDARRARRQPSRAVSRRDDERALERRALRHLQRLRARRHRLPPRRSLTPQRAQRRCSTSEPDATPGRSPICWRAAAASSWSPATTATGRSAAS